MFSAPCTIDALTSYIMFIMSIEKKNTGCFILSLY